MKRLLSFKYAISGILHMVKKEPNARIHSFATILVIFSGFYFRINQMEWLFVILAIAMVISAELFNTSLENLIDFISPEKNEKAGHAKDLAAGAVLIAAIAAALIGILIFGPRIMKLL